MRDVSSYDRGMSENLRQYTNALYAFDHVVKLTPAEALDRPSPCDGWSARDVIAHVMGGMQGVLAKATGGEPAETAVGDDHVAQYVALRDEVLAALDRPDVLHSLVDTPMGRIEIDQFIALLRSDVAVHVWDLARTAGVDERIDPSLVAAAHAFFQSMPAAAVRREGILGPEVTPAADADAQTRMLNFVGRTV